MNNHGGLSPIFLSIYVLTRSKRETRGLLCNVCVGKPSSSIVDNYGSNTFESNSGPTD